jgi:hypothetical protein
MEWLSFLQGQVLGLDTHPLICFIEQNESYVERIRPFFQAMSQGEFQVVTSTLIKKCFLTVPLMGDRHIPGLCSSIYWVIPTCVIMMARGMSGVGCRMWRSRNHESGRVAD